jgi:pheromone shutdown protein TraB
MSIRCKCGCRGMIVEGASIRCLDCGTSFAVSKAVDQIANEISQRRYGCRAAELDELDCQSVRQEAEAFISERYSEESYTKL